MEITATSVVPALATLAAAFVAGGIARSNLIASKESKISEFRQIWVGELRENLSSLFSAVRSLARAVQEERDRQNGNGTHPKFHFGQQKIVEVRHSSAELKYRVGLLLDRKQDSHVELQRLLEVMMETQQAYLMGENNADIKPVFDAVECANELGMVVVAQEWETVRRGEPEYRNAVKKVDLVLLVAGVLMLALATVAFFAPATSETKTGQTIQQVDPAGRAGSITSNSTAVSQTTVKHNERNANTNTALSAPQVRKMASETTRDATGNSTPSAPKVSPNEAGALKK
ncbi:hypothetical protein [Janthinobacterium sp. 13]|uniref:hypothetical protein n=1 Tax=Janthinobacterium sp. 13 TaxID=2035211 RepID=UPI00117ADD87|nr:hypothetical protein [Janthinobacterium sp. 13]